jgi:Domain of unknown function (DUF4260)
MANGVSYTGLTMLATISTPTRRIAYAALAAALLTASIVLMARGGAAWQFFVFGAAPDLALFAGIGAGLAKGQLHPRAVPLYNALHRYPGPIILAFVPGFLLAGLAWALHIAIDRAVGYGLRTSDGFQRD